MIGWIIIILALFILVGVRARVKKRGYLWKDRSGKEVSFKEFMGRWRKGIAGVTPLQQKKIALWSFLPLFGGLLWGIVVTFMGKTYWLTLILCGSLPLTTIQFISTLQQYWSIKKIDEVMKDLNEKQRKKENKKTNS